MAMRKFSRPGPRPSQRHVIQSLEELEQEKTPRRMGPLLFVSLIFNFLACVVILHRSYDVTGFFAQQGFLEDGWYGAILGGNSPSPSATVTTTTTTTTITTAENSETMEQCAPSHSRLPPSSDSVPVPANPWKSLTIPEIAQIKTWLEAPEQGLNLTNIRSSKTSDNVVFLIEAYYPAKDAVLAYLSSSPSSSTSSSQTHSRSHSNSNSNSNDGRSHSLPKKSARVTIHHGGWGVPVVKDYLVGPLPVGGETKIEELKGIYHEEEIPFNARGMAQIEELSIVLAKLNAPIAHVLQDLFGATANGFPNDTLVAGMSGPFSFDGQFRRMWMTWRRNRAGSFLLPVNFYQYLDVSGTDSSQWKILKHIYHGQAFDTLSSFLEAYNNDTLIRHPSQTDPSIDLSWTERTRRGPTRDLDDLPGPRSVSFAGLRFRVDREEQHIKWMGWEMYLGFDRDMGLSFWDVRFRGERIIYQLSPQEAIAQYGGNDPLQSTTAWQDRYFGMGSLVRNMIPHYDCPQEAVYLPAVTHTVLGAIRVERAICIFEQDTGKPLSRHFGYEEGEFGAIKSYVLTVRSTTTVGNYDYLFQFDYLFYLDGTIEVRLSASGYMQGGYWNPEQDGYGARIHETSMGNLHDHVINYKVDFDIAGTANSLLKTTTNQERVVHPWLGDDWGQEVIQQKITKEYITNEDDALLKYPTNFQGGYAIVNKDELNAWGYPRGYSIHPGYNAIHNTVIGSKRLLNNANWARYNLAISCRKETEPASSSMWNLHLPGAPMVDFHKFFDGENITQEDLVAWINLGMHHLPQAEDSPHTKTNIATSSFVLTPLNYFNYDISMELQNAVLLHAPQNAGDPYTFDDNGIKQNFACVPEPPSPFEYTQSEIFESDGSSTFTGGDEARRAAEMFLRVRLGAQ